MSYFESRLPADFNDFEDLKAKLKFCEILGIKNVILEPLNKINSVSSKFRENIQGESNINIYFRINLRLNSIKELKRELKKFNNFQDILSIESSNKQVQLYSAKDSRIDLISFSDPDILKTLTPGVISLTKQNKSFIEFSLAPIMLKNKTVQSKNFRILYKSIQLALKLKANYLISGNFTNIYDYRHPRSLISLCYSLLGIPISMVKKIYTINPQILIDRSNISSKS